MKRILAFTLVAISVVACSEADVENRGVENNSTAKMIVVSMEESTRVELNSELKTVWTENDLLTLFEKNTDNQQYKFTGQTGERTGKFEYQSTEVGNGESLTKNIILYPYRNSYIIDPTNNKVEVKLPSTLTYKKNSYGVGDNTMVAASINNTFKLKNVFGWLELKITGDGEPLKSITFSGNNSEQVAGVMYINPEEGSLVNYFDNINMSLGEGEIGGILVSPGTIGRSLTLNCENENITLSSEPTSFYIAIPPQTFEKGFKVDITCNYSDHDYTMTRYLLKEFTIHRNGISPMKSFKFDLTRPAENTIMYTMVGNDTPAMDIDDEIFDAEILSHEKRDLCDYAGICTTLFVLEFGKPITSIPAEAFIDEVDLDRVYLPDSIKTIGQNAFKLSGVSEIYIGSGIESIGDGAFDDLTYLTSIHCTAVTPPTLGEMTINFDGPTQIYVPAESVAAYKSAPGWSDYAEGIMAEE